MMVELNMLYSIGELEKEGAIVAIQDGNHGEKHPISDDYVESGIPFIMAKDIRDGILDLKGCKFLKKEKADSLRIGFAKPGDVLLTHKGTVGNVAIVPFVEDYVMLTPQVTYYRLNTMKMDKRFFSYALCEPGFQDRLVSVSSQSTRPYVGITAQRDLKVLCYPLHFQRKIAAILSSYDDLIENNLRRIKILEEMAQNLYREWFVNFRFPGHEQTRFVDSSLGRIPEGWDEAVLNGMAQIITGYAFKSKDWVDKGIPVIKIKNLRPGNNVDTENADCITETLSKKTNDKYRLQNGDYLIAMTGATAGKVGKLRSNEPMFLNQRVAKIKPNIIFSEYIWCSICPPDAEKAFYALADGAAQPNMSGEQIENYKLIKPSEKVIIEFKNKVHPMLSLVDKLYFQNYNLRQTRDLLLPKLISGEVDVSNIDIYVSEEEAV